MFLWLFKGPSDRRIVAPVHSIVWDRRDWAASLFAQGRGYEVWETMDDRGEHQTGKCWETCRCYGRVLKSREAAITGYGGLYATGEWHCHDRALIRDLRRTIPGVGGRS